MSSLRPPLAGLAEVVAGAAALRTVAELVGSARWSWSRRPRCGRSWPRPSRRAPLVLRHRDRPRGRGPRRRLQRDARRAAVAQFPSWETLPHERLSPARRTRSAARLAVLRRLARPDDADTAAAAGGRRHRALPDPADGARARRARTRSRCGVGDEHDFDGLLAAAGRAGLHAGRHGHQARRVRRARRHPRRLPADRRAPRARRVLGRRGQRAARVRRRRPALAARARRRRVDRAAVPRAAAHRRRSASGPPRSAARQRRTTRRCASCWRTWPQGIPAEGMESLHPGAGRGELQLLTDLLPAGAQVLLRRPGADPHPRRRPGAHRPGVPRGVAGSPRAMRRRRPDRRSGASASPRPRRRAASTRERADRPPGGGRSARSLAASRDDALGCGRRTRSRPTAATPTGATRPTCARTSPPAAPPCSSSPARHRAARAGAARARPRCPPCCARRPGATSRRRAWSPSPAGGSLRGGFALREPGSSCSPRPTSPATAPRRPATGKRLPAGGATPVDPLALTPGDYVVHAQHGIGRFVEMVQRTVGGARPASTWCSSTRRASAASPATGCSCRPTRSTSCPATSAARCRR